MAAKTTAEIIASDQELLSPSMRIPFYPMVVDSAKGCILRDHDGREYIDWLAMAAIANVGYGHPKVVQAVQEQAARLLHCNAAYAYHEPLTLLTERLVAITPGRGRKRVAYGNSGGDANDGAIKLSRAATGRQKIIGFINSYYGNTYGALSLSACSLEMRRGFGPFLPEVYHVPYPDCYRCPWGQTRGQCDYACVAHFQMVLDRLAPAEEVAAVVMEPIQGDAGIVEPPQEYVDALTAICRRNGILLVAEEVQSGMGRTGRWFASEHFGLEPDVVVMGKALASGLPLSAIVARTELMDHWRAPGHVFSTGSNPVACAAALATIAVLETEDVIGHADRIGRYLKGQLQAMMQRFEVIGDVRGRGLMLGVDLVTDRKTRARARTLTAKVAWRCWEQGLFLTFFAGSVLRIAPPLVISQAEVDRALAILEQSLVDVLAGHVSDSVLNHVKGW